MNSHLKYLVKEALNKLILFRVRLAFMPFRAHHERNHQLIIYPESVEKLNQRKLYSARLKCSKGVTLIELMISMTLGMIVIAALGYAYLGSKESFRTQDALSRMQENARTAFEILARDLRMVGFTGCSAPEDPAVVCNDDHCNIANNSADWFKNLYEEPLIGYEKDNGAWNAFPTGVTNVVGEVDQGDVLTVLHVDNTQEFIVDTHDTANHMFTVTAAHGLSTGQLLVVAKDNCSRTALFQNTCVICSSVQIRHGRDSATSTYGLGSPLSSDDTFGANARIYPLHAATYYIHVSDPDSDPLTDDGEPSLYRQVSSVFNGNATTRAEQLIEGVEDMQLSYAVDVTNPPDKEIDCYVDANDIDDATNDCGGPTPADWSDVLGVRVSLLMVSRQDEDNITTKAQTYQYNGATVTAGDKLYRKVYTTTIAIKNRL